MITMNETITPEKFEQWLNQHENQKLIKIIAKRLYQKMVFKKLSLPGLNIQIADEEEIFQELCLFILQNSKVGKHFCWVTEGLLPILTRHF